MPLYRFNVLDGHSTPDEDGTELPDIYAARQEALILAGAMIEDSAKRSRLGEAWRMEVTDENGLLLFRLEFTIMTSPAVKGFG